jgi:hypothetical protein
MTVHQIASYVPTPLPTTASYRSTSHDTTARHTTSPKDD